MVQLWPVFKTAQTPIRLCKIESSAAQSSFQEFGNPDLNPETTVSYELGLRTQFSNNDVLTVDAYYKDIFDYVTTKSAKVTSHAYQAVVFTLMSTKIMLRLAVSKPNI